ncbi:unnamed protein product [Zymoseptoria tritici ST99CH_3D7]|uniref:Phospholipid/glycerol acyltransferase domain-containing protein n=1 Tax=Zymoseptoria tritici (strain ST99CH_3D7) TaxID=1276538 RepID=A0A1X7S2D4_ZYMT9|nr:unnamed protein product [Zymoseptoria tritici ST99CH_3D7]
MPSQPPFPPTGTHAQDVSLLSTTVPILATLDSPAADPEQELLEPYAKFRSSPLNAIQELGLHILGTAWRSYDRVIGPPVFYNGFSENMKRLVLAQPMLQSKIRDLAKRRVEVEIQEGGLGVLGVEGEGVEGRKRRDGRRAEIEKQLLEVAETWTDGMILKMESRTFIRGAYYLATQLLTRAYHQGIHVSQKEVMRLKEVATRAERDGQSIIFLPCHRSHVDYVSLQLVCYRLGLVLPTVVAGDNLNFPVVGAFLQHAGAMWIRRSFGDDQLYGTLVQSYIDTLLQNGFNVECFVEGGRSRTGKLLQPKFGILSYYLESVLSGRTKDAIVCPVSTQYDKVIEVDSYISELLGQPKKKEDLAGFLSASNVLSLKLGRVDVRFHEPWSLRGFIDEQMHRMGYDAPKAGLTPVYDAATKRRILTTFGYQVLAHINDVSVVMPTALVGTVLLTLTGRSVGRAELVRRVNWLSSRVLAAGGRVAHFAGHPVEEVVDKALGVLGPALVGKVDGLPEEMYYAEDRFQLSFYRNMTIHLFISQALVCCALYTRVKRGEKETMRYQDLYDYVSFLSQLFRAEFIFPTNPLEENLQATLSGLVADGVLTTTMDESGKIDEVALHPDERARDAQNFDFYCFLLWPFIEASWLGAVSLFMLAPPPSSSSSTTTQEKSWIPMTPFADRAQLLGKTLYHRGDLSYYEAVNKEALKNAHTRSEEEGMLIVSRPGKDAVKGTPTRVRLAEEWMPKWGAQGELVAEGKLWDFCEWVNLSRRDGEGTRKEGGTVRRRILGVCGVVGGDLWETAEKGERVLEKKKGRRRKGVQAKGKL